jgi:hypothetical protein
LALIKANDAQSHNYVTEAVSLFQKALEHPGCFKRNRYERAILTEYSKALNEIANTPEADKIAAQIHHLNG